MLEQAAYTPKQLQMSIDQSVLTVDKKVLERYHNQAKKK